MTNIPIDRVKTVWKDDRFRHYLRKTRYLIFGKEADKGLIFKLFIYLLLFDTAFIYLNPLFYMITNMVKDSTDLLDPSVIWVPRTIYLGTLQEAWKELDYSKAFLTSFYLSGSVAVLQTVFCAVAGYAFARLQFPFKKTLMGCLLLTFVVPPQVLILPMIIAANQLHLLNTFWPIILPALFGHGLKGALFVIIYRQFFSTQPKELEEAAIMDGANVFKVFFKVMLPLARPAIIVVFLFSFVWSWNDFYYPSMYLFQTDNPPLSLSMSQMAAYMAQKAAEEGPSIFDNSLKMATSFLMIIPLIILYAFTQRWFVEGVERTGLVE